MHESSFIKRRFYVRFRPTTRHATELARNGGNIARAAEARWCNLLLCEVCGERFRKTPAKVRQSAIKR